MNKLHFYTKNFIKRVIPDSYWNKGRGLYRSLTTALDVQFDHVVSRKVRDIQISLAISNETERFRLKTFETKEPETLDWITKNFSRGDVLFDIGANIGQYSLFAGLSIPQGKVFAFEPESQNFARLCKNIAINCATNVVPCGFPLTAMPSIDFFSVSHIANGCSLHSFGTPSTLSISEPALRQLSLSASIDSLVQEKVVPAPTMIKVDVDGIEDEIIQGAAQTLASGSVKTLLIEVCMAPSEKESSTQMLLRQFGYELVQVSDWTVAINDLISKNLIFSKRH